MAGDFTGNVDIMNVWVKVSMRKSRAVYHHSSSYVSKYNVSQHLTQCMASSHNYDIIQIYFSAWTEHEEAISIFYIFCILSFIKYISWHMIKLIKCNSGTKLKFLPVCHCRTDCSKYLSLVRTMNVKLFTFSRQICCCSTEKNIFLEYLTQWAVWRSLMDFALPEIKDTLSWKSITVCFSSHVSIHRTVSRI